MKVGSTEIKVQGRLLRIASLQHDKYEFLDDPEPVIEALTRMRTRIDLFTFMQKLPDTQPKYRYPLEWENVAALSISTFDHWWQKQIDSSVRTKIRKAEKKGVVVKEVPFDDALVHGIWRIYNECPVRQGKPFRHYGMTLEAVREHACTFPNQSAFIGAFWGGELIGFIKLIYYEKRTQADTLHVISMIQHRDKSPMNALIAHAVRFCAERSVPYLVYANFSYGNKKQDSLSDFKESNGFQPVELPRYYVPLTPVGRAALRLGWHHGLANHIPASLLEKLRKLRHAWYNRKPQAITQIS